MRSPGGFILTHTHIRQSHKVKDASLSPRREPTEVATRWQGCQGHSDSSRNFKPSWHKSGNLGPPQAVVFCLTGKISGRIDAAQAEATPGAEGYSHNAYFSKFAETGAWHAWCACPARAAPRPHLTSSCQRPKGTQHRPSRPMCSRPRSAPDPTVEHLGCVPPANRPRLHWGTPRSKSNPLGWWTLHLFVDVPYRSAMFCGL